MKETKQEQKAVKKGESRLVVALPDSISKETDDVQMKSAIREQTLCWSCANATGLCDWSDHWKHEPIKGWVAKPTTIKYAEDVATESYIVYACPQYIQDSTTGGQQRLKKKQIV